MENTAVCQPLVAIKGIAGLVLASLLFSLFLRDAVESSEKVFSHTFFPQGQMVASWLPNGLEGKMCAPDYRVSGLLEVKVKRKLLS